MYGNQIFGSHVTDEPFALRPCLVQTTGLLFFFFFFTVKPTINTSEVWFVRYKTPMTQSPPWHLAPSLCRGFRFPTPAGHVLAWVGLALWLVAMSNLWMTAMTDPGIIPPNPSNERAPPPQGEVRVFAVCGAAAVFFFVCVCALVERGG